MSSCPVVSTGASRSCPSKGCVPSWTPKTGTGRPPAVAAVARAPAAHHPVVPHEVGAILLAAVAPADQQIFEVEGAGHGALGQDLGPELEDRIHDLLEGAGAEACDRRRPVRVDHAPLRPEVHGDDAVEAGVQRDVGRLHLGAGDDRRKSAAVAAVEEGRDRRRMRTGEVVVHAVAVDGHLDADRDQAFAGDGIDVDVVLGLPYAVGHLRDVLAGQRLDIVLHLVKRSLDHVDAVLVAESADLPLGDVAGLGLGLQVADDVRWRPGVVGDQLGHVREVHAPCCRHGPA